MNFAAQVYNNVPDKLGGLLTGGRTMKAWGTQTGRFLFLASFVSVAAVHAQLALADGKVVPPRQYTGSLEERSQEAIIIFHGAEKAGEATEDLILKIEVEGDATEFAWIVPLPNDPKIAKEDPQLFRELFNYVQARTRRSASPATSRRTRRTTSSPSSYSPPPRPKGLTAGDARRGVVRGSAPRTWRARG